jgi:AhpD family alkylhydroperoxidase
LRLPIPLLKYAAGQLPVSWPTSNLPTGWGRDANHSLVLQKKPERKDFGVYIKNNNMETRLNIFEKGRNALSAMYRMAAYLRNASIEVGLRELIDIRVSQMNGCAYCLDMHYKDARSHGETEQRLYGLTTWKETPYYTERERAALQWAEAVTNCKVSGKTYEMALASFTEEELIDLTITVVGINAWNRINIAFPQEPGTYQVGQFG